ncbi:alanine--tRNA ligase [Patescibacteria group bacterium]|nr:alanine--tRNA ligase [Patescibacteria group bacterium]MBU4458501.1 alanine--tRNA ligase [Patescibacteria group bacterium]
MTAKELKEKYLDFFESRGHKIIPSASLIPENDPTVLFTTAGMHPLVPYLLGEKHPAGNKLVNVQKCIRTSDIEKVGNDTHLTFFEMLGNWSLGGPASTRGDESTRGGYWKKEAIEMSFDFLTDKKYLGLDKEKISVSVFGGDPSTCSEQIPRDLESAEIWKSLGIKEIKFLGREDNFWGPAGKTGPCGPCTEMFYDNVEIWNDVFMEYNKTADGKYEPLKQKNVDTGMGVERTVAILNNKKSVYDIEPLKSIIEAIKKLSSYAKASEDKAERIIADHLRASVFIIADGIVPSNIEQGYIARRLIRRAIRYGKKIGINKSFTHKIGKLVINLMGDEWSELEKNSDFIIEQLTQEEEKFKKTLEKGLKEFEKGTDPFILFTTYGFPVEITEELAQEKGQKINKDDFWKKFQQHQKLSRTATAGKFKSGLADNSEQVTKLHTAAHLLLAALRKILGENVFQKGSNITAERLRLDFSHSKKMTPEQLKEVEDIVNEQIKKDLTIHCEEMSLEDAKKKNAMGVFESKYGDRVKVYSMGDFSCEICAGPHVTNTNQLGHFKILKEEASSAGVRRIKAVLK